MGCHSLLGHFDPQINVTVNPVNKHSHGVSLHTFWLNLGQCLCWNLVNSRLVDDKTFDSN